MNVLHTTHRLCLALALALIVALGAAASLDQSSDAAADGPGLLAESSDGGGQKGG